MNLYNKIKGKYAQCFKPGFKPAQMLGMSHDRKKMLRYYDGCKKIRRGIVRDRKQLISQLPQIDNSLRMTPQDGYTTFNGLDRLSNVKEVIQIAKEKLEEYQQEAKEKFEEYQRIRSQGDSATGGEPKRYLLMNVPLGSKNQQIDSPFIKLALDPTLLSIIANYIGMVPVIYTMELYYSAPNSFGGEPKGSQCYHLDHEDVWSSKVFLFIDDVDEALGRSRCFELLILKKCATRLRILGLSVIDIPMSQYITLFLRIKPFSLWGPLVRLQLWTLIDAFTLEAARKKSIG